VSVAGRILARGEGRSRRDAETEAADRALLVLAREAAEAPPDEAAVASVDAGAAVPLGASVDAGAAVPIGASVPLEAAGEAADPTDDVDAPTPGTPGAARPLPGATGSPATGDAVVVATPDDPGGTAGADPA
jgi:hypothetical protein